MLQTRAIKMSTVQGKARLLTRIRRNIRIEISVSATKVSWRPVAQIATSMHERDAQLESAQYFATTSPVPCFPEEGVCVMVSEVDGIDARLERAKENILNLTAEISTFLRRGCDGIVAPDDFDHTEQSVQHLSLPGQPTIPSRLGALAGESIYLMRSALDHLAWHLVKAAGGEPGPRTTFPVFALDPARHAESLATYQGCVEGMSDTAKHRIEKLQPYHRHGGWQQNVLWILDDLSRTDRHTALALRIGTDRDQYLRTFRADETLKGSRFGHAEDTISISGGAAAANDKKDQGTTYVSFAKFGKLTDVAAADGLYLLWHAARGIYASFAVELSSPRDLRIDRPKEAVAPPVAQLAERAEESSSDDLDRPRNVFARISR